jgi:hypothetical protein
VRIGLLRRRHREPLPSRLPAADAVFVLATGPVATYNAPSAAPSAAAISSDVGLLGALRILPIENINSLQEIIEENYYQYQYLIKYLDNENLLKTDFSVLAPPLFI